MRPPPPASATRDAQRAAARRALLLALASLPFAVAPARADERVSVERAQLIERRDSDAASAGAYVSAQFAFDLPQALQDAVNRGIALYFVVDFELARTRWYWFDQKLVGSSIEYRLSYSPLTRQYRLARGGLAQPYESIEQALATVRSVREWRVAESGVVRNPRECRARIRLRLDTSMLPKPFQVDALINRDWALASDWSRVDIAPEPAAGAGSAAR